METKHATPPRWALALAAVVAPADLAALPFIPDGWPALINFAVVLGLALAAWRAWPFHPDAD